MTTATSPISHLPVSRAEEELSALPIWTVTLGVFSLLTFGLTAVPSIICGHLALPKTRGSFEKSVTTTGLVIGYLGSAILAVWIVFLAGRLFV